MYSTPLISEGGNLLVSWYVLLMVLWFTRPEHAGTMDDRTCRQTWSKTFAYTGHQAASKKRHECAMWYSDTHLSLWISDLYQIIKMIFNYDRCLTASYESWQYLKGWGCLCLAVCRRTSFSWLDTPGYMVRVPITNCFVDVLLTHPIATERMYWKRNLFYVHRPQLDLNSSNFKSSIVMFACLMHSHWSFLPASG